MIDFIFATSYPSHFHAVNLQHNPSHYPAFARWLGSDYITKVQEWGAGIWYATMVDVDGQVRTVTVVSTKKEPSLTYIILLADQIRRYLDRCALRRHDGLVHFIRGRQNA